VVHAREVSLKMRYITPLLLLLYIWHRSSDWQTWSFGRNNLWFHFIGNF